MNDYVTRAERMRPHRRLIAEVIGGAVLCAVLIGLIWVALVVMAGRL